MNPILFIFYTLLAIAFIYQSPKIKPTGIRSWWWCIAFLIKVATGCFYGYWYSNRQNEVSDTWSFHEEALKETLLLKNNPTHFFTNLFTAPYSSYDGFLNVSGFWNDLKTNLIIKIIAVFNLLSDGNYFINVIFFSFICFWGWVLLYRSIQMQFPSYKTKYTWLVICLMPSCLFWTSGIHRDGLILLGIGAFLYQMAQPLKKKKDFLYAFIYASMWLVFIALFRSYIAILLLPLFFSWLLYYLFKLKPTFSLVFMYSIMLLMLLFSSKTQQMIIQRNKAFEELSGNSKLPTIHLQPNPTSFIKHFPEAADRAILRPYLWQNNNIMGKIASLEMTILLIWMLYTVFLFKKHPPPILQNGFIWGIILFSGAVFILIGYTIPFEGAIVRYRAIPMMLMAVVVSLKYGQHNKL